MALAGPYASLCLAPDSNHASTPPLSFLQARCPFCRPTNSVRALKANQSTEGPLHIHQYQFSIRLTNSSTHRWCGWHTGTDVIHAMLFYCDWHIFWIILWIFRTDTYNFLISHPPIFGCKNLSSCSWEHCIQYIAEMAYWNFWDTVSTFYRQGRQKHLTANFFTIFCTVPSVLWHCWLGGRKGIRPVKNWVVECWCGCLSGARC